MQKDVLKETLLNNKLIVEARAFIYIYMHTLISVSLLLYGTLGKSSTVDRCQPMPCESVWLTEAKRSPSYMHICMNIFLCVCIL